MITASFESSNSNLSSEQSSSGDTEVTHETDQFSDIAVALIIDNLGKILLTQSINQADGTIMLSIPVSKILGTESASESVAAALMKDAGFTVNPNHLLSLGSVSSEINNGGKRIHLFLHKTSQVRYSSSYASSLSEGKIIKWVHKVRIAESIKTRAIADFSTVALFEKAVLLGII
jgi:hypothetical protein